MRQHIGNLISILLAVLNKKHSSSIALQICLQVLQHFFWRCVRRVTLNRFSIFVHNKLCKVPLDSIKKHSALFLLQILPQWMRTFTIHVNFFEQVKFDLSIANEALNFFGSSWFLVVELIAWKCKDTQT